MASVLDFIKNNIAGVSSYIEYDDLDFVNKKSLEFQPVDNVRQNQFLKACHMGKIAKVRDYIAEKRPFEIVDAGGRTPLMLASKCPNIKVFNKVLEHTTKEVLHCQDNLGMNALYYACLSNSLEKVVALLERGVKVVASHKFGMAGDLSTNPAIRELIGEECSRVSAIRGLIIQQCYFEFGNDRQKMDEEIFKRTGFNKPLSQRALDEIVGEGFEDREEDIKKIILNNPTTQEELKEDFNADVPETRKAASKRILRKYGISLDKSSTKELLAELGVFTINNKLSDPKIKNEVAEYFKENKPGSVQEAIDYIKEKYDHTCKHDVIANFLKFCGYTYGASMVDESEPDAN